MTAEAFNYVRTCFTVLALRLAITQPEHFNQYCINLILNNMLYVS